jgi:hypothetical protein
MVNHKLVIEHPPNKVIAAVLSDSERGEANGFVEA